MEKLPPLFALRAQLDWDERTLPLAVNCFFGKPLVGEAVENCRKFALLWGVPTWLYVNQTAPSRLIMITIPRHCNDRNLQHTNETSNYYDKRRVTRESNLQRTRKCLNRSSKVFSHSEAPKKTESSKAHSIALTISLTFYV